VRVTARSSVYETEPVGDLLEQPDFLNAAVRVVTDLEPHALLEVCKRVERELGRTPGEPRHGPRPADVDLLLLDGAAVSDTRLVLPHPELTKRRFVLAPLAELAPDLIVSGTRTVSQALAALDDGQRVERLDWLQASLSTA
jgi:2-amino-4-hydroxy-6-hydroxymethyldihydropteridine diphosphokinase